jgi:hypothetical protein
MPYLYVDILKKEGNTIKIVPLVNSEETDRCYPFTYRAVGKVFKDHISEIEEDALVTSLEIMAEDVDHAWEVVKQRAPIITGLPLEAIIFGASATSSSFMQKPEDILESIKNFKIIDQCHSYYVFRLQSLGETVLKEMLL